MLVTTLFLLGHFFVNQFQMLVNRKVVYFLFGIVAVLIFLFFATQITYTADYEMYKSLYDWEFEHTDILFRNMVLFFKANNYSFHALFVTHIIAYTILYYFFVLKFNPNTFFILIAFIVIIFIPYINQIRYFFAFAFFLYAAYYLLYNRKLILFAIFSVLGFLSHSAIIMLYIYFLLYLFLPKKHYANVLKVITIVLFVSSYVVSKTSIITYFEHFGGYMSVENQSSVMGGIFHILPIAALMLPLYLLDKGYRGDRSDKTYIFLKRTSFFSAALIPASIFIQIIGQRYVFPFLIIWLIFFFYLIKDNTHSKKVRYVILSYFIFAVVLYLQYGLPYLVFGESVFVEELVKSIESIESLK